MRGLFGRQKETPLPYEGQSPDKPTPFIFISYRRQDSSVASRWLAETIQEAFGAGSVFIDVDAIRVGDEWPDRIKAALAQATILLVVIGSSWLRLTDRYGRRRLDVEDDWVRLEIEDALLHHRTIMPVLISHASLPEPAALPPSIRRLSSYQATELRDVHWDRDINFLLARLEELGFTRITSQVHYPRPHANPSELTAIELNAALEHLPLWQLVSSTIPGQEPKKRIELTRAYVFSSFEEAIEFMGAASHYISAMNHHPRWENLWRTVTVWLTTWDIGHRPSRYDVELAQYLDGLFHTFQQQRSESTSSGG